jgi:adenosylcobinamide-phosphate synthase
LAATSGAVNVRLGGEALKSAYAVNGSQTMADTESTPGREAEIGHLRSIVGLVWRSVVLWMVLLALLTLARLLG